MEVDKWVNEVMYGLQPLILEIGLGWEASNQVAPAANQMTKVILAVILPDSDPDGAFSPEMLVPQYGTPTS